MEKTKDHCTAFIEKIFGIYFGDCCEKHDISYTLTGLWNKLKGDMRLLNCIRKKKWFMLLIAVPMYLVVSVFGFIFWGKAQVEMHFTRNS